ncbi:DUF732 domain-containing protein [Streptomyces sp. NPDC057543]|uniref:DUF732 domain-containing protein n=1 Tax=Streptomyces sp. NPDC057543 TaxID=3346163 RepID=UPI0036933123
MRTRTTTTAAIIVAGLLVTLTACGSSDDGKKTTKPTISTEDRAAAREKAGLPPKPDAATTTAYIKALNAIDADIVHGKDEKAVDRGLNTCSSVKSSPKDQAKLVDLTNQRFTSPSHPEGHGAATAEKILKAARTHLCPDF